MKNLYTLPTRPCRSPFIVCEIFNLQFITAMQGKVCQENNCIKAIVFFFFFWGIWKLLLLPCVCSVEKRNQCLLLRLGKKTKKKNWFHTTKRMCVCVLKLLRFHVGPSLLPYFSQAWYDQMSDRKLLVFLWPLAFVLGGEKRSKRWQSATSPLIAWQHKDTDPLEGKLNESNSRNSGWCYKKKENKDHHGKKNKKERSSLWTLSSGELHKIMFKSDFFFCR